MFHSRPSVVIQSFLKLMRLTKMWIVISRYRSSRDCWMTTNTRLARNDEMRNMSISTIVWISFYHGATTSSVPRPVYYRGVMITHNDVPQSVGIVWTSDQPDAETFTWQTQQLQERDIHVPGGIRTHNPSKREAAIPPFRTRDQWDLHNSLD